MVSGKIYFSFAAAEVRRGILTQRKEDSNPRFPMAGEASFPRRFSGKELKVLRDGTEDTKITRAPLVLRW